MAMDSVPVRQSFFLRLSPRTPAPSPCSLPSCSSCPSWFKFFSPAVLHRIGADERGPVFTFYSFPSRLRGFA
jgi:hypothetical protein